MSNYAKIVNCIRRNATDITINKSSGKYGATSYKFSINGAAFFIVNMLEEWAKDHPMNWSSIAIREGVKGWGIDMCYTVKSDTDVAKAIREAKDNEKISKYAGMYGEKQKELDPLYCFSDSHSGTNPCSEIHLRDSTDCTSEPHSQQFSVTGLVSGDTITTFLPPDAVCGPGKTQLQEKNMKVTQQYTIGNETFQNPNEDTAKAERLMVIATNRLLELKVEKKERKKLFEDDLPILLERKYTEEMEELRYVIELLDEITDFDAGY